MLNTGQIVKGRTGATYRLLDALIAPTTFKAQVLNRPLGCIDLAVIKTPLESTKQALRRERNCYLIPGVRSSPYIRRQYDILQPFDGSDYRLLSPEDDMAVAPPGLVLEWMDYDLWDVPSERFRQNSNLPRIICRSILSALALLKTEYDMIHTDINPKNVFLSGIDGPSPTVKVGDLGNVFDDGYDLMRLQCLECRAPEVWRGLGVWHSSDVWSVGITLAHWLAHKTIFGAKDKKIQDLNEAWCIAKIRRLIVPIELPIKSDYEQEFAIGEYLESNTYEFPDDNLARKFITTGTLRQELEKLSNPRVCPKLLDFIDFLLVVDHTKRPTAVDALQHLYLRDDLSHGSCAKSVPLSIRNGISDASFLQL